MTYATVMVNLALDQPNEARLEAAGQIAEKFDAGVVGIAASQFSPPLYFTSGEQAQNLIDQGQAALKKRISELEAQFRGSVKNRAKFIEWRSAIDFPARFILQQARCADLIVSGGHSDALSDPFAMASPKELVMQAGRPLLVVPDTANWLDLRSVLVAWKDTTEARRAIADSLPLLRKAKYVTVAEIVEAGDSRPAAVLRVRDVAAWLARHGVTATELVPEKHGAATDQLDKIAADIGAGVIVAGAYGHSRFRELILGGMTQHLITQTTRCVLLSH
ncbi:universal stress protein [Bradyrhizobium sediminis]|uniref:Universal stress protein n=1 Tax=Bradyrhizobium sediminis TaxID=2840469 RepID=A0A975NWS7_9BRAD|nr:universal stress protein [Bradyrhizobium sediminis]QWG22101.1 universal stress protein [Bradyrhizobium sediminis]